MQTENPLREKIMAYWDNIGEENLPRDRKKILKDLSQKFDVPVAVIEKELAEWEAGKK